jgi:hypothetical protein
MTGGSKATEIIIVPINIATVLLIVYIFKAFFIFFAHAIRLQLYVLQRALSLKNAVSFVILPCSYLLPWEIDHYENKGYDMVKPGYIQ